MLEHEGNVLRVRNYTIERQTGKQEALGLPLCVSRSLVFVYGH